MTVSTIIDRVMVSGSIYYLMSTTLVAALGFEWTSIAGFAFGALVAVLPIRWQSNQS